MTVDDLREALAEANAADEPAPFLVRALAILAHVAPTSEVPTLDPDEGRRFAAIFEDMTGPLCLAVAGDVDAFEVRAGMSAAAAICRTFGRPWISLTDAVGTELMIDRICNVVRLANAVQNALLKHLSISRGEPHRRSLAVAPRLVAGGSRHL